MNKLESKEDYLERILILHKSNDIVRGIDLANSFKYSKASVSIALKKLKNLRYINVDLADGNIILTKKGRVIAEEIYERHTILTNVLVKIGVPEDIAQEDACKIEHEISKETLEALKKVSQ